MTLLTGKAAEDAFVEWYAASNEEYVARIQENTRRLKEQIFNIQTWLSSHSSGWSMFSGSRRKKIGKKQQAIVQLNGELRRNERLLQKGSSTWAREMFRRSVAVPRVSSIDVTPELMQWHIQTGTLCSFDSRPATRGWHKVGEAISIHVDFRYPSPNVIHWRGRVIGKNPDMYAPQIPATGKPCLGQAASLLQVAFNDHEYDKLVSILVRFTECAVNPNSLASWPKLDERDVPQWYRETQFKW